MESEIRNDWQRVLGMFIVFAGVVFLGLISMGASNNVTGAVTATSQAGHPGLVLVLSLALLAIGGTILYRLNK